MRPPGRFFLGQPVGRSIPVSCHNYCINTTQMIIETCSQGLARFMAKRFLVFLFSGLYPVRDVNRVVRSDAHFLSIESIWA